MFNPALENVWSEKQKDYMIYIALILIFLNFTYRVNWVWQGKWKIWAVRLLFFPIHSAVPCARSLPLLSEEVMTQELGDFPGNCS